MKRVIFLCLFSIALIPAVTVAANNSVAVSPAPYLAVTSPSGGEMFYKNKKMTITWDQAALKGTKLDLQVYNPYGKIIVKKAIKIKKNQTSGGISIKLPKNSPTSNNYMIYLCDKKTPHPYDSSKPLCVYSAGEFTIQGTGSDALPPLEILDLDAIPKITPERITVPSGTTVTFNFQYPTGTASGQLYLYCPAGLSAFVGQTNVCNTYQYLFVTQSVYSVRFVNSTNQSINAVPNLYGFGSYVPAGKASGVTVLPQ
ncbi:MAG TPA: hypothetical protein PLF31_00235 [Candidatus Paceibacterota bacterium]|nr:hypothetical protein [Candidatus Paceibacterota bacterium]